MSFSTAWLDLRESADNAARDATVLAEARAFLARLARPLVVDLGTGTGSTYRAIGAASASWRLVDYDPALLSEAKRRCGASVETVELDLTRIADIPLADADLVTASALFDLVSVDWIDAVADRLAASGAGIYAALSYDGKLSWTPADSDDDAVRDAFNAHQRRDKGFGPALGPAGAAHLAEAMRARGYRVTVADSPWELGAAQGPLQRELFTGIAGAAAETGEPAAGAWLERRTAAIAHSRCIVGHLDVLALPG